MKMVWIDTMRGVYLLPVIKDSKDLWSKVVFEDYRWCSVARLFVKQGYDKCNHKRTHSSHGQDTLHLQIDEIVLKFFVLHSSDGTFVTVILMQQEDTIREEMTALAYIACTTTGSLLKPIPNVSYSTLCR